MKVLRLLKIGTFNLLTRATQAQVPSPPESALADAISARRPAPQTDNRLINHRKATDELVSEIKKGHTPIGPAPKL